MIPPQSQYVQIAVARISCKLPTEVDGDVIYYTFEDPSEEDPTEENPTEDPTGINNGGGNNNGGNITMEGGGAEQTVPNSDITIRGGEPG